MILKKLELIHFLLIGIIFILLFLSTYFFNLTYGGYVIFQEEVLEGIKLGYCPTMLFEAQKISLEKGYELEEYPSAGQALLSLRDKEVQKILIGRRAYSEELNPNIKEEILISGLTLVSNNRKTI